MLLIAHQKLTINFVIKQFKNTHLIHPDEIEMYISGESYSTRYCSLYIII
jgi:hypothetical protein